MPVSGNGTVDVRGMERKSGGTFCPECGALVKEGAKFCMKCGVKLSGAEQKEDKVRAIRFLNESGAFLITKSGDRVCQFFGISKYTLYSYIGETKG